MKKMKTNLLILIIYLNVAFSFGQSIQINQITPTAVNSGINVNLLVTTFNGAGYLNHSYTTIGNTINISVCYWFNFTLPVYQINTDFFIEVPNNVNYIINVSVFNSSSQTVCDNFSFGPTATTNYLDTYSFEKIKNDYSIYPNPTIGTVEFKGDELLINQILVYDNFGRLIKELNSFPSKNIDLFELNDGIYLVKIITEYGSFNEKLIIKK